MHPWGPVGAGEWLELATELRAVLGEAELVTAVPGRAVGAELGVIAVTREYLAGVTRGEHPRVLWAIALSELEEVAQEDEGCVVHVRHRTWTSILLSSHWAAQQIRNALPSVDSRRGMTTRPVAEPSRDSEGRPRKRPNRKLTAAAIIGAIAVAAVVSATSATAQRAVVSRVVDGDTVDVLIDGRTERIRLLNIDTPETVDPARPVECLGREATDFLKELLPVGSDVDLEFDVDRTDPYGRTLAAVTKDDRLINAAIAAAGLGVPTTIGSNSRWRADIDSAFEEARARGLGFFDPTVECTLPGMVAAARGATGSASLVPGTTSATLSEAAGAHGAAIAAWSLIGTTVQDADSHAVRAMGAAAIADLAARASRQVRRHEQLKTGLERQLAKARQSEQKIAQERAKAEAKRKAAQAKIKAARDAAAAKAEAARKATEARAQARAREAAKQESLRRQAEQRQSSSQNTKPKSGSRPGQFPNSGNNGYTGCRQYAPGGKTWKPIPCP